MSDKNIKDDYSAPEYHGILGDDVVEDALKAEGEALGNNDEPSKNNDIVEDAMQATEENLNGSDSPENPSYIDGEKPTQKKPKKKHRALKIVLIIIAIVLIILIICGLYTAHIVSPIMKVQKATWVNIADTKDSDGITEKDLEKFVNSLPKDYVAKEEQSFGVDSNNVKDGIVGLLPTIDQSTYTDSSKIDIKANSYKKFQSLSGKKERDNAVETAINSYFNDQLNGKEDNFSKIFPNVYETVENAKKAYDIKYSVTDGKDSHQYETIVVRIGNEYYDVYNMIATDVISYYYKSYLDYINSQGQTNGTTGEGSTGNNTNEENTNK